ncbi:hypothetical protein [uncultured Gimesia sp.]|uniref:hypothetical protein n=1 Tax=uncultured Gimesia sp. TaxID=1678688 RepID=UPI0030DBD525|tara:strand:+ start:85183 stop:87336 length:2154 start_codon:yes stop_codon:yes gene_type:complete
MSVQSNQYKQILKTYWQRPLVLLLVILLLPFLVYMAVGKVDGNVIQIGPRPHAPGRIERVYVDSETPKRSEEKSLQTYTEFLEHVDPQDVIALNLIRLHVNDPLPDLSPFQNLVYLDLRGFELTDANVDQICQLPKLDALVINQHRLPGGALQRFGKKVSQIELLALTLEEHPDEISQMSNVKLLALHLFDAAPDILENVVQIPQLQQLTLSVSQNLEAHRGQSRKSQAWDYIDLNEQQIALLRNHPTLKEVYANWFYMDHVRKIKKSAFLPVRALPITYSNNKIQAISGVIFLMVILFSIVSLQLWAHFISPAARVVPHYLVPHRRVAVGIFSVGVLLFWFALLRYGFGMLPSLNLVLFSPAICCIFFIAQLSGKTYQKWLAVPMLISLFWLFPQFTNLGFKTIASTAIWFLWGQMPILSLTIIGIEIACIFWSITKLSAITDMVNETYNSVPAYSPWGSQRSKQIQWKKETRLFFWFIDHGLTKLKYGGGSTWNMVHLWRQGNTFRPLGVLTFFLLVVVFGLLFQGMHCYFTGEELFPHNRSSLSVALGGPCGMAIVIPAIIWWQRRKSLELESMRPVSRNHFVKQLYLSLALDHWLAVICLIGLSVPRLFDAPGGKIEILGMLLLLGIAGPLWLIGISSSVLAFKRSWVIVLSFFVLSVLPFATLAPVAILNESNPVGGPEDVRLLIQMALIAIPAAIGLNVLMYYAALKREWG